MIFGHLNLFRVWCFGFRAFSLGHLDLFRVSNFLSASHPLQSSVLHETLEPFTAAWMTEFAQSLGFDLADALAGYGKFLPYFFQGVIGLLADAEAHAQDLFFARGQSRQHFAGLLLQVDVDHRVRWRDDSLIFDKVTQMAMVRVRPAY